MPFELITGPVNAGKTSRILAAFRDALPRREGLLVVPSEGSALELRRHLLGLIPPCPAGEAAPAGILGDAVLSWRQLVERLAAPSRLVLSPLQMAVLVHRLLEAHPLRYFRLRRHSLGIARQFARTILALKQNGIDPKRLRGILATRGSLRENDLLTTSERYEEELAARGFSDEGDLSSLALEALDRGPPPFLDGIRLLAFDGFHRFAPGGLSMLRMLKKKLPRTRIAVAFPAPSSPDSLSAAALEKGLLSLAPLADATVPCRAGGGDEPHLCVFTPRSPVQEARAHARMIAEAIRGGTPPEEIVLAVREPTPFLAAFLREAKSEGLCRQGSEPFAPMEAPLLHELLSPAEVASWPEEADARAYADRFAGAILSRGAVDRFRGAIEEAGGRRAEIARSLSALGGLEDVLRTLRVAAELAGHRDVRREFFLELAFSSLSREGTISAVGRSLPIRCVDIDDGLALPASHVFLPRMVEGAFPRAAGERMFFAEADCLASDPDPTVDEIFPTPEEELAAEAYRFETFLAKCSGTAACTFSLIDEGGAENAPSSFLDGSPDPEPLEAFFPPAPSDAAWASRAERLLTIERERAEGKPGIHGAFCGILEDAAARGLVRERFTREALSPTRLERYAECPFAFFAEKVLGLSEPEEETPEIQPKDRGTILHAVLERFYRDHLKDFRRAAGDARAERELSAIAGRLLDQAFEEHAALVGRASPALAPLERRSMRLMIEQAILLELAEARSLEDPLSPVACEWAFGSGADKALEIPVPGEAPARIGGRIDRIDADEHRSRFLIVDYKTGRRVESVRGNILRGLHLQLPLYAEAVKRFLFPHALPLGGLLLAVSAAEKRHGFVRKSYDRIHYAVGRARSAMADEEWDAALAAALAAAAEHVRRIRNGHFPAGGDAPCPRQCAYATACRHRGARAH